MAKKFFTLESLTSLIDEIKAYVTGAVSTKVDKVSGKGLSTNDYTTTEKNKLSGIASGAQVNQNAFSNIKVGDVTVAADTTTDTLELVGSNVTITPDADTDKITIAVASGSTSTKGIVKLSSSTSSTSTSLAATPSAVKSAYDLADTAKTRAEEAYSLAEGKVDSLSDLGITATATELNYVDGVTSNIQNQLDGKAASSHTHTKSQITDFPASLKNPNALTIQGNGTTLTNGTYDGSAAKTVNITPSAIGAAASSHTHNYAGSSSDGGAATSANKVNSSLTVKLNSGTTEGTNLFTFNGSAAKSVNITPSAIGAATSSHSHDDKYYTETEIDTKLSGKANSSHGNHVPATETANNAKFLRNDNTWQTVTPANIGASKSDHTHNYAGSSSAGGAATSANKINTNAGSATQPVYFADGIPKATTYTLGKSVPSDAKFTDTTYSTMGAASSSAAGTSGLVPAPASGKQSAFLRGDGTWATPSNTKNTAGSTDSSKKLFLIGAESQAANPTTYSHDTAYVGTDGCLYSGNKKVETATELTQAQYDALSDAEKKNGTYYITDAEDELGIRTMSKETYDNLSEAEQKTGTYWIPDMDLERNASTIEYDNSASGLAAQSVQSAIDEVKSDINEVNSNINTILGTFNYKGIQLAANGSVTLTSAAPYLIMTKGMSVGVKGGIYYIGSYATIRTQEINTILADPYITIEGVSDGTYNSKIRVKNTFGSAMNLYILAMDAIIQS